MSVKKRLLSAIAVLAATVLLQAPALAETLDLLRSIPLEIKGYPVEKSMPEKFVTADEIISILDNNPNLLLVHMEALRRGYNSLSPTEQNKLLTALLKRHQKNENDLLLGFDHGYAQLVYLNNKTGLFFLRKANDQFKTQFSGLAYGMAEAEADLNLENATPDVITTRKMDVIYQLGDAVKRDAADHQPGFWPSYVRVLEKLKPLTAYQSFANRDFSLAYLPYGNSVIPMRGAQIVTMPLKASAPEVWSAVTSCNPNEPLIGAKTESSDVFALNDTGTKNALNEKTVSFGGDSAVLQFSPTETPGLYRVKVTGSTGQPLLSFETYASNRIVEDLEGDGTFEIVARQYKFDPMNPILVYRHTPCGFELDKKVFNAFR